MGSTLATITDSSFPGREGTPTRFEGLGAELDPAAALTRAVCEAAQAHAGYLVGARDVFLTAQGLRGQGITRDGEKTAVCRLIQGRARACDFRSFIRFWCQSSRFKS